MEKNFVKGSIKEKKFDNGGNLYNVWIPKDELKRIEGQNGINFTIKFGKDSGKPYMEVSDYKQPVQDTTQEQRDNFQNEDVNNIHF